MKNFIITWAKKEKFGKAITRNTFIQIPKETGDIGKDAKAALGVFMNTNGNLKKNEVFSIQEVDEKRCAIGEPILPTADEAFIPTV